MSENKTLEEEHVWRLYKQKCSCGYPAKTQYQFGKHFAIERYIAKIKKQIEDLKPSEFDAAHFYNLSNGWFGWNVHKAMVLEILDKRTKRNKTCYFKVK